jgi:hypothetical protein
MKKTIVTLFALLALTVASLAGAAANAAKGSWTGWITNERCGAKGANAESKACLEKCAKNGEKLVFYNTGDKKLYKLDNQDLAKQNIGHEVKVTGEAEGKNIKVASIEPAGVGQ